MEALASLTTPFVLEPFKRYDEGTTMKELRDWLNDRGVKNTLGKPLNFNSIQRMLTNRRYIGEFAYRDIIVPDGFPAIVPHDLFDRVQAKLEVNKKAPARHKAEDDYLLTTKLFCGYYGAYLCGESGTSHTDIDGKGGVAKTEHLFEHAQQWKMDGKIKRLGISFHSSPELLERVLTHSEIEFVQIPLNYVDWNSQLVRTGEQYEIIRRHSRQVVVMQPVKGGGLATVPKSVEAELHLREPEQSIASWAIRFIGSPDGLICTLSGMSTLDQVKDNVCWRCGKTSCVSTV